MWDFIYLYLKFLVTSSKALSVLTPGLKEKLPELQPVPAWDVSIAGGSCAITPQGQPQVEIFFNVST